jgi:hypothetical protein
VSYDRWLQRPYVEARISDEEHRWEMRPLPPLSRNEEIRVVALPDVDATLVMLVTPRPCAGCRTCATSFVNRNGRTLCIGCDPAPELPF